MGVFWRCPCGATIQEGKLCSQCGSSQSRAQGWYVRIMLENVLIRRFFKEYEVAKQVYLELKKKQELLKLSKKLKGVDENLAKILGVDEEEKGRLVKLKVFWPKYYAWMINHKKLSTVKERVSRWKRELSPFFGEKTLIEITPSLVEKFQAEMKKKGYSNECINRAVAMLRHMLSMAVKWGYLKEHPLRGKIEMLREKKDRWTFLTKEEFERLFENLSETYHDICYFLTMTGARLGEALSLKWENIIWDAGVAYLGDSKANRERILVLSDSVLEMLKRRYEKLKPQTIDRIFQHSDSEFRRAFKRALEKTGLSRTIRIHDLRHTFASWLAMKGVPLQQIKDLLGHSQISTTLRYSHLNPDVLRKAVSILEEPETPLKGPQAQTIQDKKVINFSDFLKRKKVANYQQVQESSSQT